MELEILKEIKKGSNILLHGPGGTGKSYMIRKLSALLAEEGITYYCTASTGIAALNLSGPDNPASTLHKWAGIGTARGTVEDLVATIVSRGDTLKRWRETSVLFIDEISMIGGGLFEKLDSISMALRGRLGGPFGGLQVVASGDFLQLPPVKDSWIFNSKVWKEMNFKPFIFNEPKRYEDANFFNLLMRIRTGKTIPSDIKKLKARQRAYSKLNKILKDEKGIVIKPTILYSTRRDTNSYNQVELGEIDSPLVEYTAMDTIEITGKGVKRETYEQMLENAIPEIITLKIGAQVMLKANLSIDEGLVNGSRGVVMEMEPERVRIIFINGIDRWIERFVWEVSDKKRCNATRAQIPFILAWASTIHKSQGSTLDYCVCSIGDKIFAPGQAYVALSRIRSIKGLFISSFSEKSIIVDSDAKRYVAEIEL